MNKAAAISLFSLAAMAAVPLTTSATLTGTGALYAQLAGSGATRTEGKGVLVIHDAGADARIEVTGQGRRVELPNGAVAYFGFDGQARISGPTWRVALTGADIRLAARSRPGASGRLRPSGGARHSDDLGRGHRRPEARG